MLSDAEDALEQVTDAGERGRLTSVVRGQRGLLLLRGARYAECIHELDAVIPTLLWSPTDQARAQLNRGTASLLVGDLPSARHHLALAAATASTAGWEVGAAKAMGNLGYLALLAGDIPEALRLNDESAPVLNPLGKGVAGVIRGMRARMLMSAGLLGEADAELDSALELLRSVRLTQDQAEAELDRAEVALADDRPADARRWAARARRRFASRGADVCVLQCDLIRLQADRAQGRSLAATAEAAERLVLELRDKGLREQARTAELIHADALLALGRPVAPPALVPDERIGTRLLARAVRAQRATAAGDARAAAAERTRGLVELHRYQARFGSLDLQSGASGLGRRLATEGLTAAVQGGRPQQVLTWSERARATTSRTPALRPPADPVAAEMLADLRYVRTQLQAAEQARREDADVRRLRQRRRDLERSIRARAWYAEGHGAVDRPARLDEVRAALPHPTGDGTMVSLFAVGDDLHALVVTPRSARVLRLGHAPDVAERVLRVRADLDLLATSRMPPPVREVAIRSLRAGLAALQRQVWEPLRTARATLDEGPVLVVPCAAVAALPWTALPALRGRPVTVAPSATGWLSARARGPHVPADARGVFVSGPGVERGPAEVAAAASVWPGSTLLTGEEATGPRVLAAADGAGLWHVAAHGQHDRENPLFSSVQLADGALFGYDLDGVSALPRHVVLSACDLGLSTVRSRDEAVGMTAALLHGGAVSVVAGTARVADLAASEVGVALHEGLRAGAGTSSALAAALVAVDDGTGVPPPLVCFGAGW
ncbi:CHAT domain-containing protein [Thalassiella azotivora]